MCVVLVIVLSYIAVMADSDSLVRERGSEEGVSSVGNELESVNASQETQSQESSGELVIHVVLGQTRSFVNDFSR